MSKTEYAPLPHTRVIGFGHRARTGKDIAARTIAEKADDARIYAFSDAIAAYCRVSRGMTVRDPVLLQDVGYELRETRPDLWVEALYWRLEEDRPRTALVTGVRFPNEVQMIRSIGGEVWRIDRLTASGEPFRATDRPEDHPTETALSEALFDHVLVNRTGQMDQFREKVWATYCQKSAYQAFIDSSYGL